MRCTVKFLDDVAPAVTEWKAVPVDVERAIEWATKVAGAYPGSVWLDWHCPTHGWERVLTCDACGCLVCVTGKCDCEPAEEEGDCPDCRMAGSQEHCLGTRTEKGWR